MTCEACLLETVGTTTMVVQEINGEPCYVIDVDTFCTDHAERALANPIQTLKTVEE